MAGLVVLLILAAGISTASAQDGASLFDGPDAAYGIVGFGIAILTFAALTLGRNHGVARALRELATWAIMLTGVAAGYNYRDELLTFGHMLAAEITPANLISRVETQTDGERAVRIRRRSDGHFIARAELNGFALTMLVDTGASTVVLRPADAQKLGFDPEKLRYNVPVQTANGTTYAAPIKLKHVAVGSIQFAEIDALVAKPGTLRDSLLGMSFLNRLKSYEFSGDYLTLRI